MCVHMRENIIFQARDKSTSAPLSWKQKRLRRHYCILLNIHCEKKDFHISHGLGGHQEVWRVDKETKCLPEEPSEPQPRFSGPAGQMALAGQAHCRKHTQCSVLWRSLPSSCSHTQQCAASWLAGEFSQSQAATGTQGRAISISSQEAIQRGMELSVTAQKRALRAKQTGCYSCFQAILGQAGCHFLHWDCFPGALRKRNTRL
ncbi:uncharacterized protein LOC111935742 isoform X2 [Cyanistes caeruleus]|uniref:uncharacterized protein LOC111935742 isoform X2 n=1 Tax=Cyanistes caeruleus TaxID=156563 RepID=UPI000CDA430B|nr:uncharacterized protein LOC111935742 isoform X2 [Cyanistes caeruleus]